MEYMEKYLPGLCSYTGIFMNNITQNLNYSTVGTAGRLTYWIEAKSYTYGENLLYYILIKRV